MPGSGLECIMPVKQYKYISFVCWQLRRQHLIWALASSHFSFLMWGHLLYLGAAILFCSSTALLWISDYKDIGLPLCFMAIWLCYGFLDLRIERHVIWRSSRCLECSRFTIESTWWQSILGDVWVNENCCSRHEISRAKITPWQSDHVFLPDFFGKWGGRWHAEERFLRLDHNSKHLNFLLFAANFTTGCDVLGRYRSSLGTLGFGVRAAAAGFLPEFRTVSRVTTVDSRDTATTQECWLLYKMYCAKQRQIFHTYSNRKQCGETEITCIHLQWGV